MNMIQHNFETVEALFPIIEDCIRTTCVNATVLQQMVANIFFEAKRGASIDLVSLLEQGKIVMNGMQAWKDNVLPGGSGGMMNSDWSM